MSEQKRKCELCEAEAAVYCPRDSAFLCTTCDAKVHCANFLVARHVRACLCPTCGNFTGNRVFSAGVLIPVGTMMCKPCSTQLEEEKGQDDCLSSSSSCVSSTRDAWEEVESATSASSTLHGKGRKNRVTGCKGRWRKVAVDLKVEGILVNWCRRMGLEDGRVVKMAVELLRGYFDKMTVLPFRVSLATAFWVAIKLCYGGSGQNETMASTCKNLKTLEQISGVPAKLILATEARLTRVIKRRPSREDHVEGWAEC